MEIDTQKVAALPCDPEISTDDWPFLYMTGKKSPAPARGVARILTRVLPRVEVVEFDGLGHMAPVTNPDVVNAAISRFLER